MSGKPKVPLKSALKRHHSSDGNSTRTSPSQSPSSTRKLQQQMPPTPPLTLTPSPSPLPTPAQAPVVASTSLLEQFGVRLPTKSSFFDAVIPQLNEFDLAKTENVLREEISDHLDDQFEHYYGDIQDYMNDFGLHMPTPQSLSSSDGPSQGTSPRPPKSEHWTPYDFIESLKGGKTDADIEKCPEALSRLYQATVVIFQSTGISIFKTCETERVICLSYENEIFKRVVIANAEKAKALAEKIKDAPMNEIRVSEPVRKKNKSHGL